MALVQPGSFLTLHYRLAGPAGDIINTFDGKPATLSLGAGELSPAMEERLLGLNEGDRATFELPAGEAFGQRNPEMQQWVARTLLNAMGDPDDQYHPGEVVEFATPDGLATYPREVVQRALLHQAAAVVLSHNHPSGNVQPSRADEALTQTLKTTLALIDVRVLDHVIVAPGQALSMAEKGLL